MSYRQYQFIEQFAQMQQAGHLATAILNTHIRLSGFRGCMPTLENDMVGENEFLQIYSGKEVQLRRKINSENDVLFIQGMSANTADLLEDMTTSRDLILNDEIQFSPQATLMVSDCINSDIFHPLLVQHANKKQVLKIDKDISRFKRGAMVGKFASRWIYVAETSRHNAAGQPIHALFLQDSNEGLTELIEGIAKMKLSFVSDKNSIKAVNIHLLLESNEAVLDAGKPRLDRRLYKTWQSTVTLLK